MPPHLGQQSQSVFRFAAILHLNHLRSASVEKAAKNRVAVKASVCKTGDFFDGFADADAEACQNLPDLPVRVWTVSSYDQRGQAVHHEPQVAEIEIGLFFGHAVNVHQRRTDERLQMPHGSHGAGFLSLRRG